MLPAPHRLRHRRDFGVATRRGRRAGSATVVAHLARSRGVEPAAAAVPGPAASPLSALAEPAKIGFVVSTAVGPAVVRNRVRRRLRHLAAGQLRRLPDGTLLVLRARPAAAVATAAQLGADLTSVLERVISATETAAGRSPDVSA